MTLNKLSNFGYSTLQSSIAVGATSLTIAVADAAKFPTIGVGEQFLATIFDGSNLPEIVTVTAAASNVFTITRAQESTAAVAWAAGSKIRLSPTAGLLNPLLDGTYSFPALVVAGAGSFGGVLSIANGTNALPGLAFASDLDCGVYRIGANNIGVAVNGAKVLDIATTGLSVVGALAPSGDFAVATNKFTVASASGNTVVAGTLGVTGDIAVATNKFTVAATSGNTVVAGTLGVTGDVAVNTNKFNVTASSGAVAIAGDVAVATNKFTVASASGNTVVAGTLGVTGDVAINTNKFNITASSGATTAAAAITATAFIPSSSTIPTNGLYLPAANTLGLAINSAGEVQLTSTAMSPVASDGNALGTTALMWSDLFVASGAVLNFNNGDVTLTHATGKLTSSGLLEASGFSPTGSAVTGDRFYLGSANNPGIAANGGPVAIFTGAGASPNYFAFTNSVTAGGVNAISLAVAGASVNTDVILSLGGKGLGFVQASGSSTGAPAFVAKGFVGLTVNIMECQKSDNTVVAYVTKDGDISTATVYKVAGTQVVKARIGGWTAATNTKLRTTFDTTTVTTANLAARVGALIDDLHSTAGHGLIGA